MTTPELHADDLLDKEARGELSGDEQARLDGHLAACSVCRFERTVREDFRAEFEADAQRERRAVRRSGGSSELFGNRTLRTERTRGSRPGTVLLLVAALLIAGVATAEWAHIQGGAGRSQSPPSALDGGASNAARRHPLPGPSAAAVASAPSTMPSSEQVALGTEPSAIEGNAPPVRTREPRPSGAPAGGAPNVAASSAPVNESAAAASAGSESAPSAEALFGQANQLRERGAYDDAVRSYTGLIDAYPGEPEAIAAHAMLGRLLLDRGDPQAALAQFDAYLAKGALTLAEEAQLGRALALRNLGRAEDEVQAWKTLLAVYPSSVHSARARERLSELGVQ